MTSHSGPSLTYDALIIGGGSAGLPAAMYLGRYKHTALCIARLPGGMLTVSHNVQNYPGVLQTRWDDLMQQFEAHAVSSGATCVQDRVTSAGAIQINSIGTNTPSDTSIPAGACFMVGTESGNIYYGKRLLIAIGNKYRMLDIPGESEYFWKGVSTCATCDGMFYRNQDVVVVGGWDSALTEALYLSDICRTVHIVHRRDTFRAEAIWVEQIQSRSNVVFHMNRTLSSIDGDIRGVVGITFSNGESLDIAGVFVAIGNVPDTSLFDSFNLKTDNEGYIVVDSHQATSAVGVYAAWDISTWSAKFKQTIMSAAEGCLAAHAIHQDLLRSK
jgi:thioredoxin reductase (NADPH)